MYALSIRYIGKLSPLSEKIAAAAACAWQWKPNKAIRPTWPFLFSSFLPTLGPSAVESRQSVVSQEGSGSCNGIWWRWSPFRKDPAKSPFDLCKGMSANLSLSVSLSASSAVRDGTNLRRIFISLCSFLFFSRFLFFSLSHSSWNHLVDFRLLWFGGKGGKVKDLGKGA